jgi:hypothetical protein
LFAPHFTCLFHWSGQKQRQQFHNSVTNPWDFCQKYLTTVWKTTHCTQKINSPFCVPAKITKLIGLKNKGGLSPINLVTFAVTQNGEYANQWDNPSSDLPLINPRLFAK